MKSGGSQKEYQVLVAYSGCGYLEASLITTDFINEMYGFYDPLLVLSFLKLSILKVRRGLSSGPTSLLEGEHCNCRPVHNVQV